MTLGTNGSGGDNFVLNNSIIIYNLGIRAHVLKNLYGRCIAGTFEKVLHEDTLWRGNRAFISFILNKKVFLHIYHCGDVFYKHIYIYIYIYTKMVQVSDQNINI